MAKGIVIPSNPKDRERIGRLVQEGVDCMTRIAAEKDAVKDIVALVKEEFELPPKYVNKMITTKYNGSLDKINTEMEDFVELYGACVK